MVVQACNPRSLGGKDRNISEFEASLIYRVSSRSARDIQKNPVLKTNKQTNKQKNKSKKPEKNGTPTWIPFKRPNKQLKESCADTYSNTMVPLG